MPAPIPEPNRDVNLPTSDSLDVVIIRVQGGEDTTVRPMRPELRAAAERLLRQIKQSGGETDPKSPPPEAVP